MSTRFLKADSISKDALQPIHLWIGFGFTNHIPAHLDNISISLLVMHSCFQHLYASFLCWSFVRCSLFFQEASCHSCLISCMLGWTTPKRGRYHTWKQIISYGILPRGPCTEWSLFFWSPGLWLCFCLISFSQNQFHSHSHCNQDCSPTFTPLTSSSLLASIRSIWASLVIGSSTTYVISALQKIPELLVPYYVALPDNRVVKAFIIS